MANALGKLFGTNQDAEQKGIEVEVGQVTRDGKEVPMLFILRRSGGSNLEYKRTVERLTKPHRRAIEKGKMDLLKLQEITKECFLESVLIGWENIPFGEGKDQKFRAFNIGNARILFDLYPELLVELMDQAQEITNFQSERLEEEAKN
jgi:hypothetical protein